MNTENRRIKNPKDKKTRKQNQATKKTRKIKKNDSMKQKTLVFLLDSTFKKQNFWYGFC